MTAEACNLQRISRMLRNDLYIDKMIGCCEYFGS